MKTLPTKLDRYPAKMVSHLADRLLDKYALGCSKLLDPFCGSGAILSTARRKGINVTGIDINPYATLLSGVKLQGFQVKRANELCQELINQAKYSTTRFPIEMDTKDYWFTKGTIDKYERLRHVAKAMNLVGSKSGRAVLLSLALSVRRCSRADQRSPKPFISKDAITTRKGKHFDPYIEMTYLLNGLSDLHGGIKTNNHSAVIMSSFVNKITSENFGKYSHIITSPPYINAQDYFRNFKLELYILENLLPFTLEQIKEHFVGTERGDLATEISKDDIEKHYSLVPQLRQLSKSSPRLSAVVHRYLCDMSKAFNNMKRCLRPKGVCVIVCGDNLIGGYRLRTWEILNTLLAERGFVLFDLFTDSIAQRMLPPKRAGHKGIIKEEIVSAFHVN